MIKVNLDKARELAHETRRRIRQIEFTPLDIKAIIPSEADEAEAARQEIRDRYAVIQEQMDAASSVEELKELLPINPLLPLDEQ